MASKYIQKFPIPQDFPNILHDLAKEVLRYQPEDIIEFSALYFKCLQEGKELDYNKKGQNIPCDFKNVTPGLRTEEEREKPKDKSNLLEAVQNSKKLAAENADDNYVYKEKKEDIAIGNLNQNDQPKVSVKNEPEARKQEVVVEKAEKENVDIDEVVNTNEDNEVVINNQEEVKEKKDSIQAEENQNKEELQRIVTQKSKNSSEIRQLSKDFTGDLLEENSRIDKKLPTNKKLQVVEEQEGIKEEETKRVRRASASFVADVLSKDFNNEEDPGV